MASNVVGTMLPLEKNSSDLNNFYICKKCISKDEEILRLQREISSLNLRLIDQKKKTGNFVKTLKI